MLFAEKYLEDNFLSAYLVINTLRCWRNGVFLRELMTSRQSLIKDIYQIIQEDQKTQLNVIINYWKLKCVVQDFNDFYPHSNRWIFSTKRFNYNIFDIFFFCFSEAEFMINLRKTGKQTFEKVNLYTKLYTFLLIVFQHVK